MVQSENAHDSLESTLTTVKYSADKILNIDLVRNIYERACAVKLKLSTRVFFITAQQATIDIIPSIIASHTHATRPARYL